MLRTDYSMDVLEKNLEALVSVRPKLVRRISWPVNGDHIGIHGHGKGTYRLHASEFTLSLRDEEIRSLASPIENHGGENHGREILVIGVGFGEHIDYLLKRFPDRKIVVWDRDPFLVRLFMMGGDYSSDLSSGRLDVRMCGDLVHLLPRMDRFAVVFHPLLKHIYHNDIDLMDSGLGNKRALVNATGLFVDDVAQSLQGFGYSSLLLDMNRISTEEIENAVIQFMPTMVFSVNYYVGLSELCEKFSLPLVCWEVDPCMDGIERPSAINEKSYIFTFRRKNVGDFISAGFDKVHYLPLAANCETRIPMDLSEEEQKRYSAPLSFVGSSMARSAREYKAVFAEAYEGSRYADSRRVMGAEEAFEKILEMQSRDYATFRIPELCEKILGPQASHVWTNNDHTYDLVKLLGESAASQKRLAYLSALGPQGVRVWGDVGWKATEPWGGKYMGFAGHKHELNKIYNGSLINIDVNRLYQPDMVNMRIFDVMACGGFVLAEYSEALEELFALDEEVVAYRTLEELLEKVEYFLSHPSQAREIGRMGLAAVLDRHTVNMRVGHMLEVMDGGS